MVEINETHIAILAVLISIISMLKSWFGKVKNETKDETKEHSKFEQEIIEIRKDIQYMNERYDKMIEEIGADIHSLELERRDMLNSIIILQESSKSIQLMAKESRDSLADILRGVQKSLSLLTTAMAKAEARIDNIEKGK